MDVASLSMSELRAYALDPRANVEHPDKPIYIGISELIDDECFVPEGASSPWAVESAGIQLSVNEAYGLISDLMHAIWKSWGSDER